MDKILLSVIIPCYNSGNYLSEAIESVKLSKGDHKYEIIIINDGSTETETLKLLKEMPSENIKVIHQENKGPASARNAGIREAQSKYILFLDSDNKIKPKFISTAIKVFESNSEIDIVYGKPEFFGEVSEERIFKTEEFDLDKIWSGNYIDMCSMIRKSLFDSIGMLDENPILIGHEDWEYWIRAGIENKKIFFIDEVVFEYRMANNSLITQATDPYKFEKMIQYLYGKNYKYFQKRLSMYNNVLSLYNNAQLLYNKEKNSPFRTFIKIFYFKYYSKFKKRK
ncbi:MAG: glycosyltransferase family A protein [Bacteroidota bacterium]|nr:glycosyltransferase family A protein [Bacteroidota bacterium]